MLAPTYRGILGARGASKQRTGRDAIGAAGLGNSGKRQGEASDRINKGEGATTKYPYRQRGKRSHCLAYLAVRLKGRTK